MKILRKLARRIEITWDGGILKVCVTVHMCVSLILGVLLLFLLPEQEHAFSVSLCLISPFVLAA